MQTLRIFENAVEAEILRTRLDAAGILSVVNGGEVATMLSHIGTAAAKVRVEVAPEDYDRAVDLLDGDDLDRASRTAWFCSRCDERNEPLFDLCWSCGKQRADLDAKAPAGETATVTPQESGPIEIERPVRRLPPSDNPYAPTLMAGKAPGQMIDWNTAEPDEQVVELVSRILRGAVFGTVVVPPLLTLYVLVSLMFRVPGVAYRAPGLRWRLIASWIICLVSLVSATILWTQLSGFWF